MVKLSSWGVYFLNNNEVFEDSNVSALIKAKLGGNVVSKEEAAKNTIAYGILADYNTSGNMLKLNLKFDALRSHDIS